MHVVPVTNSMFAHTLQTWGKKRPRKGWGHLTPSRHGVRKAPEMAGHGPHYNGAVRKGSGAVRSLHAPSRRVSGGNLANTGHERSGKFDGGHNIECI